MPSRPDVIVCGAGPGGASAAFYLAKAGVKVHLLDKGAFPREKACGDAVGTAAAEVLHDMGLDDQAARWFQTERMRLTSPGQYAATLTPQIPKGTYALIVPREEFDFALLNAAVGAGAEFWDQTKVEGALVSEGACTGVRLRKKGAEMDRHAPLIIAADGHNSAIGRSLGAVHKMEHTAFAVRSYIDTSLVQDKTIDLYFEDRCQPGYAWCFPVADKRVNVGIGMRATDIKNKGIRLNELMDAFVAGNPWLRERVGNGTRETRKLGAPLPSRPAPVATVRDGCIFVGDAAGFVDAMTGEGIAMAMVTGKFAAAACVGALGAGQFTAKALAPYDKAWKKRFGASLAASFKVQTGFANLPAAKFHESMDKVVEYASRKRAFGTFLGNLMSGVLPKHAIFSPLHIARITIADAMPKWGARA